MTERSLAAFHTDSMARTSSIVSNAPVRIGVFGMAPDTGNMGVSALCYSYLAAIRQRLPNCEIVLFDNGTGVRSANAAVGGSRVPIMLCGARGGRRYYRPENLHTMSFLARLGKVATMNPVLKLIDSCSAIMDASAGDSFSDIYGNARFKSILLPKLIAARRSRPLLLLPQTYGPFRSDRCEALAREAVLGSGEVWARDENSFEVLKALVGGSFDSRRHHCGVDMAFGLPARRPSDRVLEPLADWLDGCVPVTGINVSGLIWHLGSGARYRFKFKADYAGLVSRAVAWLLANTDDHLLLVPHVLAAPGTPESDTDACRLLIERLALDERQKHRVRMAPACLNEQQLKWLIGRCAWFCGTRMHATIAALSSGVPTASIVYSDKAAGVFASCDQQEHIIDPRACDTDTALERFVASYQGRNRTKARLVGALRHVQVRLDQQMNSIARFALSETDEQTCVEAK